MKTELMIAGFLLVNKPIGFTSHDAVAKVRGLFGRKLKVGHGGTLDPAASGLLVLGLGAGTKALQNFLNDDKEYLAEMQLGVQTDTQDAAGQVLQTAEPSALQALSEEQVFQACQSFVGVIEQIPPMYSAKKVQGQRLYKLARKGEVVEREAKQVCINALDILEAQGDIVRFKVSCSKGTYIRTLCHDIGQKLGIGAHLKSLVRTRSGEFDLSQAYELSELQELSFDQRLNCVIPL